LPSQGHAEQRLRPGVLWLSLQHSPAQGRCFGILPNAREDCSQIGLDFRVVRLEVQGASEARRPFGEASLLDKDHAAVVERFGMVRAQPQRPFQVVGGCRQVAPRLAQGAEQVLPVGVARFPPQELPIGLLGPAKVARLVKASPDRQEFCAHHHRSAFWATPVLARG
jgi:hypothetical protein